MIKDSEKEKILRELKTSLNGLSTNEAKKRQTKYGLNELPKAKQKSIFMEFLSALADPIIYVLMAATILSFIIGETVDAIVIIFIIIVDAIVSTVQEYRAEKSSEALKELIKFKVKVIRDGRQKEIDSSELTIGDIIVVEPGTRLSADARILSCSNLTIDESVLTGESLAVTKEAETSVNDEKISKSNVYAGTSVLTGRALAVVYAIGVDTEVGKIAEKVSNTKDSKSPLTARMEKFSKQITLIIVAISIIIAFVLKSKGYAAMEIFMSVVALSVSAMPEGLPLAVTMALTIGSKKMSKRNVIVKKLNSVESLGSCTVIASDKTGTLTLNEQTAKKIILCNGETYNVNGTGYNDDGNVISLNGAEPEHAQYISELGAINNEAMLDRIKNKWEYYGDSVDVAFLALARKTGGDISKYEKIDEIPYESENKYSACFYKKDGKTYCTAKGSLEVILDFCTSASVGGKKSKLNKEEIIKQQDRLALNGYRVIALCDGEIEEKKKYNKKDIGKLNFVGLVAFIDPVRKEVPPAIKECKKAGIKVLMVTGDYALTALAISKELGLAKNMDEVATGSELEKYMDDQEKFDEFVYDKCVFARVTPIQKLKIIESLQRQGEFVAVTGDGVNDAPAIKAANIGIAMGSGTDVAKETAKMIIIDDNFASIVAGIEEGRNAYSNIRKISWMLLSCGFAEVLFFSLSIAFDLPIPLVAIQLLWLNLVTDGLQDMALSFERETDTIMKEPPRDTKESLFEKELIREILISGLFIGLLVFIIWEFLINNLGMEIEHARGYILALMVFIQNIHVLNCRSEKKSIFDNKFSKNPFVIIAIGGSILLQIIVMEVPFLSKALQTYNISYYNLVLLFLLSLSILFVMEIHKRLKFRKK